MAGVTVAHVPLGSHITHHCSPLPSPTRAPVRRTDESHPDSALQVRECWLPRLSCRRDLETRCARSRGQVMPPSGARVFLSDSCRCFHRAIRGFPDRVAFESTDLRGRYAAPFHRPAATL